MFLEWLLNGDTSISFQTKKYLLNEYDIELQQQITTKGYGKELLNAQNPNGQWGVYYYQPKWTSTHYTLLDLKNLETTKELLPCKNIIEKMFNDCQLSSGGLNLAKTRMPSDICVDGMILNYSSYYLTMKPILEKLAYHLVENQKTDGGFTWHTNSTESDLDTSICVAEGFASYLENIDSLNIDVKQAKNKVDSFLVQSLNLSNNKNKYSKLIYPYRYHYSNLRCLEYLISYADLELMNRETVLNWITQKQKNTDIWILENSYPGKVHFDMEKIKEPSRWITLKMKIIQNKLLNY